MPDMKTLRHDMVRNQIEARGIRDPLTLDAMRTVPRELFISQTQQDRAYDDRPLTIASGQTISQPYIVALMVEALNLSPGSNVLEIGSGSGYAAAILASVARQVHTVERIAVLAQTARANLKKAGFTNVHVHHDDGLKGWPDAAPYDAILVSAAGETVPDALKKQLKTGGSLVIPVGPGERAQEVVRIIRTGPDTFTQEDIADVRFVPLLSGQVGDTSSPPDMPSPPALAGSGMRSRATNAESIRKHAIEFDTCQTADIGAVLRRIGDRRLILIGEATHGTHEFYTIRNIITRALVEQKGFRIIAIEADWPDARRMDDYVRGRVDTPSHWQAFARFPTWMWRNRETATFTDWLKSYNDLRQQDRKVAIYGLDLYSLYNSASIVISYLDSIDPEAAELARRRYGCLTTGTPDPALFGQEALSGKLRNCQSDLIRMLTEIVRKKQVYDQADGDSFLDLSRNAHLIVNAEKYYRTMHFGSRSAWNLRDNHMFQTLEAILQHHGSDAKAIIWAHNSHIGDARFTDMGDRGEHNLGELCARGYPEQSWRIGMGTHKGSVTASSGWNRPIENKLIPPSHPESHEYQFHLAMLDAAFIPLDPEHESDLTVLFRNTRLQRAIGVVYNPATESQDNYLMTKLYPQFNDYIWFRETTPVTVLQATQVATLPNTYPFGL